MQTMNLTFDKISFYPSDLSDYTSRKEVSLSRVFNFINTTQGRICIPIVASNIETVGNFQIAKELSDEGCLTALHKFYSVDELTQFAQKYESHRCFFSVGLDKKSLDGIYELGKNIDLNQRMVCFDVANGYMKSFLNEIDKFKNKFPNCLVLAGNVISKEVVKDYVSAGVSIIKVGIGGSVLCRTRQVAAVGGGQFSVLENIYDECKKYDIKIMSDGGIREPGDVCKALIYSDFVMVGSLFGGASESTGNTVVKNGQAFKELYGMASAKSMQLHHNDNLYRPSEGNDSVLIPDSGPIRKGVLRQILGGIRSNMTYCNTPNIEDIQCSKYILV